MIDSCQINATFVKRDEPTNIYKDSFYLNVYDEFKQQGPNTWKGTYQVYTVTVTQRNRYSDIKEEDVTIEKNAAYKEDPNIIPGIPSKKDIAIILTRHLDNLYS